MTEKTLSKADLAQFTGSQNLYRHGLGRNVLYTEGAQYVAEHGGAYWLIDEIVFSQADLAIAAEKFQVWHLAVNADETAILICEDGNNRVVFTKQIAYTDFPLSEICFYFIDNTLLLPGEY